MNSCYLLQHALIREHVIECEVYNSCENYKLIEDFQAEKDFHQSKHKMLILPNLTLSRRTKFRLFQTESLQTIILNLVKRAESSPNW